MQIILKYTWPIIFIYRIMNIIVFTDGACSNNGKHNAKAGYGIYYPNNEFPNVSEPFTLCPITNQRAELYAIFVALSEITKQPFKSIVVYTDSTYSIDCTTKWIAGWKRNGWLTAQKKPVKNVDIIKPICDMIDKGGITFVHVRSHTGKDTFEAKGNERADELAVASIN